MATAHYNESDNFEAADAALRGALAIGAIVADVTVGESKDHWSDHVVDDLQTASKMLIQVARERISVLHAEKWTANALLGMYGPEAKAKALARSASDDSEASDEWVDIPVVGVATL